MNNLEIITQTNNDLTTITAVKEYIPEATDDDNDILTKLITRASKFIKNHTDRELNKTVFKEAIDGDNSCELFVSEYPIISVENIKINNAIVYENGTAKDGNNYYIYQDIGIIRRSIYWPKDFQNIEVNYTAGYETIPEDLEQAVIELVAFKFMNKDFIGLGSHSLGDENLSFKRKDIPEEILSVIECYKKVNI